MIDFHCHLDLYKDPLSLLPKVEQCCEFVLAVTTSPRAWEKTSKYFSGISCIHTAIGLHPELVLARANEREILIANIPNVKFVGEVGIDGTKENIASLNLQKEIFSNVVQKSEQCGGKIISVHSRNATTLALDIIEKHANKSIHVLHWFSGTIKELERAISLGCWFSINTSMLSSKKGVELVSRMPKAFVLPETDGPFIMKNKIPFMPWETTIVTQQFANIHCLGKTEMDDMMKENLNRLMMNI